MIYFNGREQKGLSTLHSLNMAFDYLLDPMKSKFSVALSNNGFKCISFDADFPGKALKCYVNRAMII